MRRQPQFESDRDRERIVNRFTLGMALKLILLWAVGIAGMIWVAWDGYHNHW